MGGRGGGGEGQVGKLVVTPVTVTEAGLGLGEGVVMHVIFADVVTSVGVAVADNVYVGVEGVRQVLLTAVESEHVGGGHASPLVCPAHGQITRQTGCDRLTPRYIP